MFTGQETVQVLTAGTKTDEYGNTEPDWSTATTRDEKCLVGSGGSTEPLLDARTPIDSDFDLVFPGRDPGVTSADRVIVRGLTCDVSGRPFAQRYGSGDMAGTVVKVKIREG